MVFLPRYQGIPLGTSSPSELRIHQLSCFPFSCFVKMKQGRWVLGTASGPQTACNHHLSIQPRKFLCAEYWPFSLSLCSCYKFGTESSLASFVLTRGCTLQEEASPLSQSVQNHHHIHGGSNQELSNPSHQNALHGSLPIWRLPILLLHASPNTNHPNAFFFSFCVKYETIGVLLHQRRGLDWHPLPTVLHRTFTLPSSFSRRLAPTSEVKPS